MNPHGGRQQPIIGFNATSASVIGCFTNRSTPSIG
jgi:hypothetical protein